MIGGLQFKDPPDWGVSFVLFGSVVFGIVDAGVTALALGMFHALPLRSPDPSVEAVFVGLLFSLWFAFLNRNVPISIAFGVINAGIVRVAVLLGFSAVIAVGVSNGLAVGAVAIAQIVRAPHEEREGGASSKPR